MFGTHAVPAGQAWRTPFLARVYGWMALGLLVSAGAAVAVVASGVVLGLWPFAILAISELVLVIAINALADRLSATAAGGLFLVYSALTGATLSGLLLIYGFETAAVAFLASAGMFGVIALVGATTHRDLSTLGSILFMALVGLVLASFIGVFWNFPGQDLIVIYVGLAIFLGLTLYDGWRIQRMAEEKGAGEFGPGAGLAVQGALTLYLDLINIFIRLLAILGGRRRR